MNNAIFSFPKPANEPSRDYAPGSEERKLLKEAIEEICSSRPEITPIIYGEEVFTGDIGTVVMPHDHKHVLATYHKAGAEEVKRAIQAAMDAHYNWEHTPWIERATINLKIAQLIEKKYRYLLNAATMMCMSKTVWQAEIEAASETIDYLRHAAYYMSVIYGEQPTSEPGAVNHVEYRPLEGFVYSISPFNFTALGCNLPMAPVVMGNTVVWKPATNSLLSSYYLMKIFMEAGLPDGVLNFMPGKGSIGSKVVLKNKNLAGIHFTGSTAVFKDLWTQVGANLDIYKSYPRLVGETGGKDFIFMHNSADARAVAAAIVRGAFEFQGQKCSATSRGYIPRSRWKELRTILLDMMADVRVGDPRDFRNFMAAVIDEASFDNCMKYIEYAKSAQKAEVICGGTGDKSVGYFVEPTIVVTTDPHFKLMEEEIFGPVMTLYVYEDDKYEDTLHLCDETSPYGLTGSLFANERSAIRLGADILKYASGILYINDKTTAASIGLQPFGGSRASGTNDKAGSNLNLIRWVTPRTIKENLLPPADYNYPYMGDK